MIQSYYRLTKPGIIRGNLFTAISGYFFAVGLQPSLPVFIALITGLSLVIAASCVLNNILDAPIDRRMKRTEDRALVTGKISTTSAAVFAAILGCIGIVVLLAGTTIVATLTAIIGMVAYVILYGWAKRRSVHGTLVGTISGSTPPVIGYTAATGSYDIAALLLFIIIVCWQMPHFYAIAMYRYNDYKTAGIPVLPVSRGFAATKLQSIGYTLLFLVVGLQFTVLGFTGYTFAITTAALALFWAYKAVRLPSSDHVQWGRTVFRISLIVMPLLSALLPVGRYLP